MPGHTPARVQRSRPTTGLSRLGSMPQTHTHECPVILQTECSDRDQSLDYLVWDLWLRRTCMNAQPKCSNRQQSLDYLVWDLWLRRTCMNAQPKCSNRQQSLDDLVWDLWLRRTCMNARSYPSQSAAIETNQ